MNIEILLSIKWILGIFLFGMFTMFWTGVWIWVLAKKPYIIVRQKEN